MKKKWLIFVTVAVLVAITTTVALAAGNDADANPEENSAPPAQRAWDSSVELTDGQKAEIMEIHKQMAELKKEMIDKYKSFGAITEEKAEEMKEKIEEKLKYMEENGICPGLKSPKGTKPDGMRGRMKGGPGKGFQGRFGRGCPQDAAEAEAVQ